MFGWRKKIEQLRKQPEHVRYRAVSYFTLIGGVIVVVLWLAVLLPLQLYFQRDAGKPAADESKNVQPAPAEQTSPPVSPSVPIAGPSESPPLSPTPSPSGSPPEVPVLSPSASPTQPIPSP